MIRYVSRYRLYWLVVRTTLKHSILYYGPWTRVSSTSEMLQNSLIETRDDFVAEVLPYC